MLPLPPNTINKSRINKSLLHTINISTVCFRAINTKLLTSEEIVMIAEKIRHVDGHNLSLRRIQPDDAEYVFDLRTNPSYNEHLSDVTGSVEDQRQWIETYKSREAKLSELYYMIERKDGLPRGVVRLYDIEQDSFTWGIGFSITPSQQRQHSRVRRYRSASVSSNWDLHGLMSTSASRIPRRRQSIRCWA
jgi:hypothetical protein